MVEVTVVPEDTSDTPEVTKRPERSQCTLGLGRPEKERKEIMIVENVLKVPTLPIGENLSRRSNWIICTQAQRMLHSHLKKKTAGLIGTRLYFVLRTPLNY